MGKTREEIKVELKKHIVEYLNLLDIKPEEIEDDQPVTENNEAADSETELAENDEDEISKIIKAEIFEEGKGLGDLVLETMVAALSKDDGGITAQMLGKSFINSGQTIPKELVSDDVKTQLPKGINLNTMSKTKNASFSGKRVKV